MLFLFSTMFSQPRQKGQPTRSSETQICSDIVRESGMPEVFPEQPGPVHTPSAGDLGLQPRGLGGHLLLHETDLGQPLSEHGVRGQGPFLDTRYVLQILCLETFA